MNFIYYLIVFWVCLSPIEAADQLSPPSVFRDSITVGEAMNRWARSLVSDRDGESPLGTPVEVSFYETVPGMGWTDGQNQTTNFYGINLPPLVLSNGNHLVPIVGKLMQVEHIQDQWQLGYDTLKDLLNLLNQHHSILYEIFLKHHAITHEEILEWSYEKLLDEIPDRVFFHAQELMLDLYFKFRKERKKELEKKSMDYPNFGGYNYSERARISRTARLKLETFDIDTQNLEKQIKQMMRSKKAYQNWHQQNQGTISNRRWIQYPKEPLRYFKTNVWLFELIQKHSYFFSDFIKTDQIQHGLRVDIKPSQIELKIKVLEPEEIERQFGLKRVKDPNNSVDFQTYDQVVGRLFFTNGLYQWVHSISAQGKMNTVQSLNDLIGGLIRRDHFVVHTGRIEFKALGAKTFSFHAAEYKNERDERIQIYFNQGKVSRFSRGGGNIFKGARSHQDLRGDEVNPILRIVMEEDGRERTVSYDDILSTPGILLNAKYQPNFPSPPGVEVKKFSDEAIQAQDRFLALGGGLSESFIARIVLAETYAGTIRMAQTKPYRSIRLNQALAEWNQVKNDDKLLQQQSVIGQWIHEGRMTENLESFFYHFGKNQRALLASGKLWIRLGERLLHNRDVGKVTTMEETYKFFLNNTDLIDAKQADLGDFMSLSDSLNNDDIKESIAIIFTLAGEWLNELEMLGLLGDDPETIKQKMMKMFLQGFDPLHSDTYTEILPVIRVNQLRYEKIKKIESGVGDGGQYHTHERHFVSDLFNKVVDQLFDSFRPLLDYWPILPYHRQYSDDYETSDTLIRRFTPYSSDKEIDAIWKMKYYDEKESYRLLKREYGIDLEVVNEENMPATMGELLKLPDYEEFYFSLVGIQSTVNDIYHPVIHFLKQLIEIKTDDEKVLFIKQNWGNLPLSVQQAFDGFPDLLLAIHHALANHHTEVRLSEQTISLTQAVNYMNQWIGLIKDNFQSETESVIFLAA